MVSNNGMAQGMKDHALSLWRFASGLIATTHQGFATPHARTGQEIHGTDGSLLGDGVVHQAPAGRLSLTLADGERDLPRNAHNLYEHCLGEFHKAVRGEPHDMATGESGQRSLALVPSLLESAPGPHRSGDFRITLSSPT